MSYEAQFFLHPQLRILPVVTSAHPHFTTGSYISYIPTSVLHSSVFQWTSSHGCAPFTAGAAWLSDDYWWRQIDGVGPSWWSPQSKQTGAIAYITPPQSNYMIYSISFQF